MLCNEQETSILITLGSCWTRSEGSCYWSDITQVCYNKSSGQLDTFIQDFFILMENSSDLDIIEQNCLSQLLHLFYLNPWLILISFTFQEHMFANLSTGECVWEPPVGVPVKKTDEAQWWELFDQNTARWVADIYSPGMNIFKKHNFKILFLKWYKNFFF